VTKQPFLDLSQFDLITASEKLYQYVRDTARSWGQDPDKECIYLTPRHPLALERGPFYRVMWEAGPYEWGSYLSLGGVTFKQFDGSWDSDDPELVIGNPSNWYLEPYFNFDVGFIPDEVDYWNLEPEPNELNPSIIQVGGLASRYIMERLDSNPELLKALNRRLFEEVIAEVFHRLGYEVELTKRTRDGGKDIIAVRTIDSVAIRYLIECKRPDPGKPIGVSTVRELLGVSVDDPTTKALLVTTTSFTRDANLLIDRHRWRLEGKAYEDVVKWISQYNRLCSEG